jgi:hypothetical protein
MASLVLGVAGNIVFPGVGGFVGATIGSFIDQALFGQGGDSFSQVGPRIADTTRQAHAPGSPIPFVYGTRVPTGGALIWTSNLIETAHTEAVEGGKGDDSSSQQTVTTYTYSVNIAVMASFAMRTVTGAPSAIRGVTKIYANKKVIYDSGSVSRADAIRISLGGADAEPDAMLEAAEGAGNVPAFRGRVVAYIQNLQLADFGNTTPQITFELDAGDHTVRTVLADQYRLAGMDGSQFDLSCLTAHTLTGMTVAAGATPRRVGELLQIIWPFDVIDKGGLLTPKDRSVRVDAVVLEEDFGTYGEISSFTVPERHSRLNETEFPRTVHLQFIDPDRELDVNTVQSGRLNTRSQKDMPLEVPIVLTASAAKEAIDSRLVREWSARRPLVGTLPHKYLTLESGDVFAIRRANGSLSEPYILDTVVRQNDTMLSINAIPHVFDRSFSAPGVAQANTFNAPVLPVYTSTGYVNLDVPLLSDSNSDTYSFYTAGWSEGAGNAWTGWSLNQSIDGGTNYSRIMQSRTGIVAGSCVTALGAGAHHYPDRKNTVRVNFASTGVPTTITNAGLQRGENAAVVGVHGRWEIIQFRDAALVTAGIYDLSHLIRGRKGTEHNIANHAAGDGFYIIDSAAMRQVALDLTYLNTSLPYKGVSFNRAIASTAAANFTASGEVLKPYSGVRGTAVKASGDWTITWTRRNRILGGFHTVPMSEASEHYEIDVIDTTGSVKRTITVSTPSATYSSAQQVTDFGATQASITVNTYQMSQTVGRGNVHQIRGQT